MNERVPLVDIPAQQAEIMSEIRPEVDRILTTGAFVGGKVVSAFEESYAALAGSGHCIGVANGTDALEIALRATGVRAGSEVILPANSFIATAEAAHRVGADVVLVDADDEFLLIDPALVKTVLTDRTAAVVPVHLYGQMAPVEQIEELDMPDGACILEDAAQSQGARRHGRSSGSLGVANATSFYPGKNLGAAGDAGAVTTDDPDVARVCRLLANHGSETRYVHEVPGFNSRLDALQAVVLLAKLGRLHAWNERRREAARRYADMLAPLHSVRLPATMPGNEHVWHLYPVRVPHRDLVARSMRDAGVEVGIHYPTPLHLTRAFRHLGYARGDFPVSEQAAGALLSLPLHPHLTERQQERVVAALDDALARHAS
jgi:dTDP-4-amino-4,6-dideoxygalactose transaminase